MVIYSRDVEIFSRSYYVSFGVSPIVLNFILHMTTTIINVYVLEVTYFWGNEMLVVWLPFIPLMPTICRCVVIIVSNEVMKILFKTNNLYMFGYDYKLDILNVSMVKFQKKLTKYIKSKCQTFRQTESFYGCLIWKWNVTNCQLISKTMSWAPRIMACLRKLDYRGVRHLSRSRSNLR
jgi:hypothetical protein